MTPMVFDNVLEQSLFERMCVYAKRVKFDRIKLSDTDFVLYHMTPDIYRLPVMDFLEKRLGRKLLCNVCFFRLNDEETDGPPQLRIHTDSAEFGSCDLASVFYLEEKEGYGTALFEHEVYGKRGDKSKQVFKTLDGWTAYQFIQSKSNRLAVYEADMFHSRWPNTAYGHGKETGRIVCVNFMRYGK